jgi:hypothetical protein
MARTRSVYERLALKQKVEMVRKSRAMQTLRDELDRGTNVGRQLTAIVDDTAIKKGASTGMHIRSASWYSGLIQEQLATINNRNEFLAKEVSSHEEMFAADRHRHELSVQKGIEHRRAEREAREERAAALLPNRRRPTP